MSENRRLTEFAGDGAEDDSPGDGDHPRAGAADEPADSSDSTTEPVGDAEPTPSGRNSASGAQPHTVEGASAVDEGSTDTTAEDPAPGTGGPQGTVDAESTTPQESTMNTGRDVDAGSPDPDGTAGPTVTFTTDPAGGVCEDCGATVSRRWRDGDRLVCPDCKEW